MKKNGIYYKELAVLYFPNSTVESARHQFRRWITYNKELQAALQETGFVKGQRMLTPRQVEVVFRYLGEP